MLASQSSDTADGSVNDSENCEQTQGTHEISKRELTLSYLPPKRSHLRRKRPQAGADDLIAETVPLNDARRVCPQLFSSFTSRADASTIHSALQKVVASDAIFFEVSTYEPSNPFGPVYREIHGLDAVCKFFSTYFQAIPDCILSFDRLNFFKRLRAKPSSSKANPKPVEKTHPGESELHATFTMSGSMAFSVVVNKAEPAGDLQSAIEGLQGLQAMQSGAWTDKDSTEDAHADKKRRVEDGDVSTSTAAATSSSVAEAQAQPQDRVEIGPGDHYVVIDSSTDDGSSYQNMIIASESTEYKLEQRAATRSFNTSGEWTFFFNKDKKLVKCEVSYSAQKSADTCRYFDTKSGTSSSSNSASFNAMMQQHEGNNNHSSSASSVSETEADGPPLSLYPADPGISLIHVESLPPVPSHLPHVRPNYRAPAQVEKVADAFTDAGNMLVSGANAEVSQSEQPTDQDGMGTVDQDS